MDRTSYTDNLTLRSFTHDPYPVYRCWRQISPMLWDDSWKAWLVTGYTEVERLLRERRLSSELLEPFLARVPKTGKCPVIKRHLQNWVLYRDPPEHTQLRSMSGPQLTLSKVESLRAIVDGQIDTLLDKLEGPVVDLVQDLALPLATHTLFILFGAHEVTPNSLHWGQHFAQFIGCEEQSQLMARQAEQAIQELEDQFIENLDQAPVLRRGFEKGEMISMCSQIILAGQDTTTGLVTNGMLALLQDPQSLQRLIQEPNIVNKAIDELLRFDAPSQLVSRLATEDLEFEGHVIRKGEMVNLFLGAANRDPARFDKPDTLVFDRPDNRHLSFGKGTHFCLGAALARLQVKLLLPKLLRRFPKMKLAQRRFPRHQNLVVRNLKSLNVRLG